MSFEIRRLAGADAAAFAEIRVAALKDVPSAFSEALEDVAEKDGEYWRERVEANVIYGLFDPQESLLGVAQIDRYLSAATRHRAWLTGVYLRPETRGRGAGKALVNGAVQAAGELGVLQVHLGVDNENEPVKALYRACGFEPYGTEPRALYADGAFLDELLMVRFLDKDE